MLRSRELSCSLTIDIKVSESRTEHYLGDNMYAVLWQFMRPNPYLSASNVQLPWIKLYVDP